jgi:hypothetical protein
VLLVRAAATPAVGSSSSGSGGVVAVLDNVVRFVSGLDVGEQDANRLRNTFIDGHRTFIDVAGGDCRRSTRASQHAALLGKERLIMPTGWLTAGRGAAMQK